MDRSYLVYTYSKEKYSSLEEAIEAENKNNSSETY